MPGFFLTLPHYVIVVGILKTRNYLALLTIVVSEPAKLVAAVCDIFTVVLRKLTASCRLIHKLWKVITPHKLLSAPVSQFFCV